MNGVSPGSCWPRGVDARAVNIAPAPASPSALGSAAGSRSSIQWMRQSGARPSSRARPRSSSPVISPRGAMRGSSKRKIGACPAAASRGMTSDDRSERSSAADAARPSQRATWSTSSSSPRSMAATSCVAAAWTESYPSGAGAATGGPKSSNSDAMAVIWSRARSRWAGRTNGSNAARATSSSGAWSTKESAGSSRGTARISPMSATSRMSDASRGVVNRFGIVIRGTIRLQVSLKSRDAVRPVATSGAVASAPIWGIR